MNTKDLLSYFYELLNHPQRIGRDVVSYSRRDIERALKDIKSMAKASGMEVTVPEKEATIRRK